MPEAWLPPVNNKEKELRQIKIRNFTYRDKELIHNNYTKQFTSRIIFMY